MLTLKLSINEIIQEAEELKDQIPFKKNSKQEDLIPFKDNNKKKIQ